MFESKANCLKEVFEQQGGREVYFIISRSVFLCFFFKFKKIGFTCVGLPAPYKV